MDGQKQPEPAVEAKPEKQPRHSFMDIRRPKVKDAPTEHPVALPTSSVPRSSAAPSSNGPEEAAPEKLADAPPEDGTEIIDDSAKKQVEPTKAKPIKAPKSPKPPRQSGVGLAIFATIVIILGLGALATYAYLRGNNIAPF